MKLNYCLIGDIHSQDVPLRNALDYCEMRDLTPVLLGDLFDSRRSDYSDSYAVYGQALRAQIMGGIILQSNHQNKLIRYLRGRNVQVRDGLEKTIKELFEDNFLDKQVILEWLQSFPYALKLKVNDKEYRLAHAYFPDSLVCDDSLDFEAFYYERVNGKQKSDCMYGLTTRTIEGKQDRVIWWQDESYRRDFVRVGGHYHWYAINTWSMLLDGECGTEASNARLIAVSDLGETECTVKEFHYE